MRTTEYTVDLSERSRLRVRFASDKNTITDFSVNFEILLKRKWATILRYDTAHDHLPGKRWKSPHKHIFHVSGAETIVWMKTGDYNSALTMAYKDIKNNFRKIKRNFFQ